MKAVLFIHGLSAKHEDNKYFISYMKNKKNIDFYTFILPGHEQEKMTKVNYKEWLKKSEEELNKILKKYSTITVVAHSMGAIIAVNLAYHYQQINKLVLLAPAFIFGNIKQNKEDIKKIINRTVDEDLGTGFEGSLTKFKNVPFYNMIEYRKMALKSKKYIKFIKCKTLILQGDKDNLVSIDSAKYVYDNLNTKKEFVIINNVRHQIFKSNKKEQISKYIYQYINGGMLHYVLKRKEI